MRQVIHADEVRWAELSALIEKTKKEVGASSRFKLGQLVLVCQHLSFSLNSNATCQEDVLVPTHPHDHSDPAQHFYSRIVGWDCLGRIEVATSYGDNPHCCDWCWSEDMLQPMYGPDWAEGSKFQSDMTVYYTYELAGFSGNTVGRETEARLVVPHIKKGDWIVSYPREDSGTWIPRVLNEKQMRLKRAT